MTGRAGRDTPGQPSKLDQVALARGDGDERVEITILERIVELVAQGEWVETAAAYVGINTGTLRGWLRIAAKLYAANRGDRPPRAGLTEHEALCVEFFARVGEANARFEIGMGLDVMRLARGGIERKVVTVTQSEKNGLTTTETVEVLGPDLKAIDYRLKHRFPKRYGDRVELVTDPDEDPLTVEDRAAQLVELLREEKARRRPRRRKKTDPEETP